MKKLLAIMSAMLLAASLLAGCGGAPAAGSGAGSGGYELALVTDIGTIDDKSFNQGSWEGLVKYAEEKGISHQYYKPTEKSTDAYLSAIDLAVKGGAKIIVCPGFLFQEPVQIAMETYPDVKFIALDVAAGDLLETAVAKAGEAYDYTPENWDLNKYVDMSNVYCAVYQEELCGYMAGYAAVKLGYKNLGFLGGMSVPAVVRYGYGFVQGVDAAAADLGLTDVKLNYIYGGQFFGDADITAVMDTWYQGGTEVVFACGGGIYTSAVDAAKKVNAKVIGVDVDQAGVIANYAGVDGMTVTSAMKGLYPATYDTLTDVIVNGNWEKYVGKIETLGLVSGTDPEANYVQIPMGDGTQWSDSFTQDDYKAMVKDMFDGKITVSNNTSSDVSAADFATVITVDDQGSIKG